MDLKENDEFISDLAVDSQSKIVLATSGDGTLTVINLRRKKLEMQSELFDSEFLSLAIVKVRSACYMLAQMERTYISRVERKTGVSQMVVFPQT